MGRPRDNTWARDALLPAVLAALATIELAGIHPDKWQYGVAAEVLACLILVLRRRLPLIAPVAATLVGFSVTLMSPELREPATPVAIGITAVYSLARWNRSRRGLIGMSILAGVATATNVIGQNDGFDITDVVFVCALLIPPYVLGRLIRRLADQADQLERQQEVVRRAAVHDERDRIARDLHDVIAHSVSAMVVQTAAAQDVIRTDPAKAEALLESVAATGRGALAETGRLLHVIRDEDDELGLSPAPGLSRVDELVENFRASGLAIDVRRDAELPTLSGGADVSAYRVVQEALTNALKYAPDRAVMLELDAGGGLLRIHTSNWSDGGTHRGAGLGLTGMRERLAVVGGELIHGPTAAGKFELTATVPVAAP